MRAIQVLQHLAQEAMQAHPISKRQFAVESLTDEGMREAIVSDSTGDFHNNPRGDRFFHGFQNVLALARGEPPPGIVNREVLERPGFQKKLASYR